MPATRQPLFLARDSYRKRRLRDGARVLPIFGTVLFLLPLMWPAVPQMVLAHWAYVFALWVALIGLAVILARGLGESETASSHEAANAPAQDAPAASNKDGRRAREQISRSTATQGASAALDALPDVASDTPRALHHRP
jgi:hypothetical protein